MTTSRGAISGYSGSSPSAESADDERARAKARVGTTVKGKWRLDSLLGVGGMAAVFAATHRNGSRAALKILHAEFARDPQIRDRFLREGYVANRIDHAGRVAILDDDATEHEEPFLVMELLEGETVQQLWKRNNRRVPPAEALWIAAEVLDTLVSFHAEGIIHRDLKPANIFVTHDNVVKLLDFGVARMRDAGGDKTRAGTALGTPSFMAPEQAMGLTDGVDGRADIFSLGATLYALLSGQRLHQGRSDNEAFILAATTPAPSLARMAPEHPVAVIALVDKALAWDKRNRFETALEMRTEALKVIDALGGAREREAAREPRLERPGAEAATERPAAAEPESAPAPAEIEAEPNAPAVLRLVDAFKRLDRLLPAVRHYGWTHPEADSKLRATYQGFAEALREDPEAVFFRLSPYAFSHRGQTVWEPQAPLDTIPYELFAAGLRKIEFRAGFTEEELKSFCEVMMLDPGADLPPEDDIAAALWEKGFEHVHYEAITVLAEGDAADREAFWDEADAMEVLARKSAEERQNRAEAAAMAVQTDEAAVRAARSAASVLALDPVAKKALGAQLVLAHERYEERLVDVIADALEDARKRGDVSLVVEALGSHAKDLVRGKRTEAAFALYESIGRALDTAFPERAPEARAALASGMFAPETIYAAVDDAVRPAQGRAPSADLDALARSLEGVLGVVGAAHVGVAFELAGKTQHEGLRRVLFAYVEKNLAGHEREVAPRLMMLDAAAARPFLRLIAESGDAEALAMLRDVAERATPDLRCEAVALLAGSPEELRDELLRILEGEDAFLRMAAVRTLAAHQVRSAGPVLVRRVQDPSFQKLSLDERREVLAALFALHSARAETVAIELLQKHGMLGTDEALEQTRALGAELLGRYASSDAALEAVLSGLKRRWWNSQLLRDASMKAAEAIAGRTGKRISAAGEIVS